MQVSEYCRTRMHRARGSIHHCARSQHRNLMGAAGMCQAHARHDTFVMPRRHWISRRLCRSGRYTISRPL